LTEAGDVYSKTSLYDSLKYLAKETGLMEQTQKCVFNPKIFFAPLENKQGL